MKTIEIIKPDDWHVHFRDGEILKAVVPETSRHFKRAIIMPNLVPPILTGADALEYRQRIKVATPNSDNFIPLMTLYLTETTNKIDLESAFKEKLVFAAKLYPAGATTNSDSGVKNIKNIMPLLETMSQIGMPLLVHGEVTNTDVDIFDREKIFIDTVLDFLCEELPELKITMEHITTEDATSYVKQSKKNLSATITPHHLALNRNSIFVGGIKPHYYCLPILKRERHRKALVNAAISGNEKFFLGTDTAPHLINTKENSCGCAGIFNSTYCIPILAEIFDKQDSIHQLEKFTSTNGAKHYNLKVNLEKIKLIKSDKPIQFKKSLKFKNDEIIIFKPDFPVFWKIIN